MNKCEGDIRFTNAISRKVVTFSMYLMKTKIFELNLLLFIIYLFSWQ